MLKGGFQEFIVERISGNSEVVRMSYAPVECAALARYSPKSRSSCFSEEGLAVGRDDSEANSDG